jgi:hypothetical protein
VNLKRIMSDGQPRVIALVRDIRERKEADGGWWPARRITGA